MLVVFLIIATLAILITGISFMAFGGKLNEKYGNKLMALRVTMQALAILALLLMYFSR